MSKINPALFADEHKATDNEFIKPDLILLQSLQSRKYNMILGVLGNNILERP